MGILRNFKCADSCNFLKQIIIAFFQKWYIKNIQSNVALNKIKCSNILVLEKT